MKARREIRLTRDETAKLLAVVAANWPQRQNLDMRATAELWHATLGDLPRDVVWAAVMRLLTTSDHWPTVAEIRRAAAELRPDADKPPSPEEAWAEVQRQVRLVGYYGTPRWSHPAVAKAAEALYGSWQGLCANLSAETAAADRAHFLRLYQEYSRREREDAALPAPVREMVRRIGRTQPKALPEAKDRDG